MDSKPTIALENGLNLREVLTTGSVLQINDVYDDGDCFLESDESKIRGVDSIGKPISNFAQLEETMTSIDDAGYVKKRIIDEGGGIPLNDVCTVSVAFSGYWENDLEPFDCKQLYKPLVVDLKENGLLPGLQLAIQSMLVGETSLFLFTHHVMYGEMGIPPRIKPKAKCAFYIKLIKCILTPSEGPIDFSQPNQFDRVHHEAKKLYSSGNILSKTNNFAAAIHLYRKSIFMLHKCRLANENEEKIMENMLAKVYLCLAFCYNKTNQPSKACTACNELKRLNRFWNNSRALFQNAKALRMIGEYDTAEKRLKQVTNLQTHKGGLKDRNLEVVDIEREAIKKARKSCNQAKLLQKITQERLNPVTDDFKAEVDSLIKGFKQSMGLCKLILPSGLNSFELAYIKDACVRGNLFFNITHKDYDLEDDDNNIEPEKCYALDKFSDNVNTSIIGIESSQEEDIHYDEEVEEDKQ